MKVSRLFIALAVIGVACSREGQNESTGARVWPNNFLISAPDLATITNYHGEGITTFLADGFGRKLFFVSRPGSGANNIAVYSYTNVNGVWRQHGYVLIRDYPSPGEVTFTNAQDGVEVFWDRKSVAVFR